MDVGSVVFGLICFSPVLFIFWWVFVVPLWIVFWRDRKQYRMPWQRKNKDAQYVPSREEKWDGWQ